MAPGDWDPHFVVPRPSLIARIKRADLVFMNGAELEIGWLPALLKSANNPKVAPGAPGLVDLSADAPLIHQHDGPVSRAMGDVHPAGNPHFALDPLAIPRAARTVAEALSRADPAGGDVFIANLEAFEAAWHKASERWRARMAPLRGTLVIEYHAVFDYFLERNGISVAGAIEPIPGASPTARHTKELVELIRREKPVRILMDVYHSREAADFLSRETGVPVVVIPHDVGAVPEARDLFSLYDTIVERMLK